MAEINLNASAVADPQNARGKKWMTYQLDDGNLMPVFITEAIGIAFGFGDFTEGNQTAGLGKPAGRIEMRHIECISENAKIKRSYPCGTPTIDIYSGGGTVIIPLLGSANGLKLTVTGAVGEKRTFASHRDTFQDIDPKGL